MSKDPQNSKATNTNDEPPGPVRILSREVAQEHVDRWQKGEYQIVPSSVIPALGQLQLDSFSFSLADFTLLVSRVERHNHDYPNDVVKAVICRIGLKYIEGEERPIPCMFFEPMTDEQPGRLLYEMAPPNEWGTYSTCYDVSYPCPPTCPHKES